MSRLDLDDEQYPGRIANQGAHFSVLFPVGLAINAFDRRHASYVFEGTDVGELSQFSGKDAAENGTWTQPADRVAINFRIVGDRCLIDIEARLMPEVRHGTHLGTPELLQSFTFRTALPVADGLSLFPDLKGYPKERLGKIIQAIQTAAGS